MDIKTINNHSPSTYTKYIYFKAFIFNAISPYITIVQSGHCLQSNHAPALSCWGQG